jgi:hypothetical protein
MTVFGARFTMQTNVLLARFSIHANVLLAHLAKQPQRVIFWLVHHISTIGEISGAAKRLWVLPVLLAALNALCWYIGWR